jgi:hypothetical protein
MSDRRKFTPQFKADVVALVLSSGPPVAAKPDVVEGTFNGEGNALRFLPVLKNYAPERWA